MPSGEIHDLVCLHHGARLAEVAAALAARATSPGVACCYDAPESIGAGDESSLIHGVSVEVSGEIGDVKAPDKEAPWR